MKFANYIISGIMYDSAKEVMREQNTKIKEKMGFSVDKAYPIIMVSRAYMPDQWCDRKLDNLL